jgi:ribose 5-phosphate isomerase A
MTIFDRALELILQHGAIGLGSGSTASRFLRVLGDRVLSAGLPIRGVPTSEATAALAREVGIPLTTLAEAGELELAIDGADEVDPQLDLIKGYGRALLREKIVAAASRRLVILVTQQKLVPQLGTRGRLPIEIAPFALPLCQRRLMELNCPATLWSKDEQPLMTENGNFIIDCQIEPLADPARLERDLRAIPGVVCTGLFLGMAHTVLVGSDSDFRLIEEKNRLR